MRGLGTICIVCTLVSALLVAVASVSSGQNLNEADALNRKSVELYNAGKYEEAIPIAQRSLAISEKASVVIIPMSLPPWTIWLSCITA